MWYYQTLVSTTHGRRPKSHTETVNLKYQEQYGINRFNSLMDLIPYQQRRLTNNTNNGRVVNVEIAVPSK